MSVALIPIRSTIKKHPTASKLYGIDWTDFVGANAVNAHTWSFEGPDNTLTVAGQSFTATSTTVLIGGGTLGAIYKVFCQVGINGSPGQVEVQHFFVEIAK